MDKSKGRWVPLDDMRPEVADRARLFGFGGMFLLHGPEGYGAWGRDEADAIARIADGEAKAKARKARHVYGAGSVDPYPRERGSRERRR